MSSCSTKLYAGYSNQQVVTWVKPETTDDENGEYVMVQPPPTLLPPPTQNYSSNDRSAQTINNLLKNF